MNDVYARQYMMIETLEAQLQHQRGMLWVLGEIMKAANNINSFKELMKVLTDMLMGVTGVNTCYLWHYEAHKVKVYLRSTQYQNTFMEWDEKRESIASELTGLRQTHMYTEAEINEPLIEESKIPNSRLAVPLWDYNKNIVIGALILEHEEKDFFNQNIIIFFETLAVFIGSNIKNSKLFESVAEESEMDMLTQTYNRRALSKVLEYYVNHSSYITIGVLDIDNFKKVNDTLGHIKGDEVLNAIATEAKNRIEPYEGKVFRYGGDEFVLLIPNQLAQTIHILEDFQKAVPEIEMIKALKVPVSITMGICDYPTLAEDSSRLVVIADNALIRGKKMGKNRIILANQEDLMR